MKKCICAIILAIIFPILTNLSCYAITVPASTSIFIIPKETVTSKDINANKVNATIQDDVIINGKVIFKSGAKAELSITEVEKARCWGKAGKLTVVNGYAYDTKGIKHKILLSRNYYGEEKTWPKTCGVISIFFLFPLALFGFVHGGQAAISSNTEIETNLASQFEF